MIAVGMITIFASMAVIRLSSSNSLSAEDQEPDGNMSFVENQNEAANSIPTAIRLVASDEYRVRFMQNPPAPRVDGSDHGQIYIQYEATIQYLSSVPGANEAIVWKVVEVVEPSDGGAGFIAYTSTRSAVEDIFTYLIVSQPDLRYETPSPAHTDYVSDGRYLIAYDFKLKRALWAAAAQERMDAILGIVAGMVVTAEAGDIVCRDVVTGLESLRFPMVFPSDGELPERFSNTSGIYFDSGLALVDVGQTVQKVSSSENVAQ